jgi:N-acetylglucosaminyl-diphospho-decaprenol L-rhamnosyltransferase
MAHLDIVILNYNRGDLLRSCLRSVVASRTTHTLGVWVVDNASSDDSVAIVRAEFPQVRLIVNERNSGFASGNNLALREIMAAADPGDERDRYVMLLNNDTVVEPDALDRLIDYLEQHPSVGAVGPKVLLLDGSLDLACRRSFPTPTVSFYRMTGLSKLFPRSPRFGRYNLTYLDPDVETEVDALVGAAMLLRAEVLREVGLLDEQFFMYGEDVDWCYRIKAYGWRIIYYPRAVIHHHKRAASSRRALPSIRAFYDAMRIFHRKHYAQRTLAPVNCLIETGITLKEWWAIGRNLLRPATQRRVG